MLTNENSIIKKAEEFEKNNDWENAVKLYQSIDEKNILIISKIGWCFSRLGNYRKAVEEFKKCCVMEPLKAKWDYMVGYQFYSQKDWENAIRYFEIAVNKFDKYFIVRYRLAYAYLQKAGEYKQLTKAEFWKAIGHLENCHSIWLSYNVKEKNDNKLVYFDICFLHGKTLLKLNNYTDKAIELLRNAMEINNTEDCCYELAKAYFYKREYESALNILPKTNKYYIKELRVNLLIAQQQFDEALIILYDLLKYRKKDYLFITLARVEFAKKNYLDAFKNASKAIELNPNNHKNHFAVAVIYEKFGLIQMAYDEALMANKLKLKSFSSAHLESLELMQRLELLLTENYSDDESILDSLLQKGNCKEGVIKTFKVEKGFGFITSQNEDFFFHQSNCLYNDPKVGDKIKFKLGENNKGIQAIEIIKI